MNESFLALDPSRIKIALVFKRLFYELPAALS